MAQSVFYGINFVTKINRYFLLLTALPTFGSKKNVGKAPKKEKEKSFLELIQTK